MIIILGRHHCFYYLCILYLKYLLIFPAGSLFIRVTFKVGKTGNDRFVTTQSTNE